MHPSQYQQRFIPPVVQVKVPAAASKKKKKGPSCARQMVECIFFLIWLFCTAIAGYFIGYDPSTTDCPDLVKPVSRVEIRKQVAACPDNKMKPIDTNSPLTKPGGFTIEELKAMWQCSHAEANYSEVNKQIFPDELSLAKTKWKSIISVEPKAFFNKYLSQYPSDTRAVQPVVVFSHLPLNGFNELDDVCKVIDIAIVPDKPGVCVAVTETYHDVASYHMLHADRQSDGTFALTGNSLEGRTLPTESAYAAARALLLDFFKYQEKVNTDISAVPRFDNGRVVVCALIDDEVDLELFMNSLASATKPRINQNKYAVFTTSQQVRDGMKSTKVKTFYLPYLAEVGTKGDANVGKQLRRYFLQAWLAFAVANQLAKALWQSPGTIWFERPDNIINAYPAVEMLWAYHGREDKRAAPFFPSTDFFVPVGNERPVHLLHELILHFDLVIAWKSLDAVAAYRLSENNSRYGTTTYIMAPHKVLHTDLMGNDALKLKQALAPGSEDLPHVVIVPKNFDDPAATKRFLMDSGLWML